uniref:Argininosuccinate lyase n=1 Tax=Candidatus Kentrum eta TaxID=2126337 RepID=A0A450UV51_9GAMM|nr:MAG: argininosuccinate lyase [Candidatus Kentron sp. H]VFJ89942.1 MAG: argininosuccinate lyase [Candidatus Kentron sp. H]VFJ96320.1 MAG: argininosuccinate lyase [Candidatus Kentron sp. H]
MSAKTQHKKPWSGRFAESTTALVKAFTASVSFDRRLYPFDILGSIAHATMLAHVGVLSLEEREAIVDGLEAIGADIEAGRFQWSEDLEDVHMNIEAELVRRIGEAGKKLHTGRSRNDQVATDLRLYLREETDTLLQELGALQTVLLDIAEREFATPMPGFTHLQIAQPVTFGHHMLAWFEMLSRDRERLSDAKGRINRMPLGAAALAGTGFPIDRTMTAELLGFDGICENSLDAVSDRDFAIEFTAAAALIMTHLSRMSEELILWSSPPFDFIELGDGFCTGSSIMPQKKNPDVPELVRGKTGRVDGHLLALLVLMKGQPLAYNRDNQEDKEALFDTVDTVKACVRVYAGTLASMGIKHDRLAAQARKGFSTATDLADYLVGKGLPFRDAHEVVGKAVRYGIETKKDLSEMTLTELRAFFPGITENVFTILSLEGSLAARNHLGGTAPEQVLKTIGRARARTQ